MIWSASLRRSEDRKGERFLICIHQGVFTWHEDTADLGFLFEHGAVWDESGDSLLAGVTGTQIFNEDSFYLVPPGDLIAMKGNIRCVKD
jgi:hypothetical protein